MEETLVKAENTSTENNEQRVYTTLHENAAFNGLFTIYSKAQHYDQPSIVPGDEHDALRKDIEKLHLDVEVRPWLYGAMKLKNAGKNILFLTDRLSLNTYKRSSYEKHPGLWDLTLCEHDMRHDQTLDVREDYGEHKDHDGPLDVWFRNRVNQCQMKMFIKIAHSYPDVWNDLIKRDGEEIRVKYAEGTLTLHLLTTDTTYTLSVAPIKIVKEINN